jgi:hypothetical protein
MKAVDPFPVSPGNNSNIARPGGHFAPTPGFIFLEFPRIHDTSVGTDGLPRRFASRPASAPPVRPRTSHPTPDHRRSAPAAHRARTAQASPCGNEARLGPGGCPRGGTTGGAPRSGARAKREPGMRWGDGQGTRRPARAGEARRGEARREMETMMRGGRKADGPGRRESRETRARGRERDGAPDAGRQASRPGHVLAPVCSRRTPAPAEQPLTCRLTDLGGVPSKQDTGFDQSHRTPGRTGRRPPGRQPPRPPNTAHPRHRTRA